MKIKYKTRKTISKVISLVMVCLLAIGGIMGLSVVSEYIKDDTKVIRPTFEVGGLDDVGQYKKTESSIYTKNSFECLGLEIKLDFDSNVKYQVYFYDSLDKFVSHTEVHEESVIIEVPENVTYARLVVIPVWGSDVKQNDRVCHWYDTYKYANALEIRVLKDQCIDTEEEVEA